MNFILKPSLQHIAVVKIVTTLWIQDDIRDIVEDFRDIIRNRFSKRFENQDERWDVAGNKITEKVNSMSFPDLLKRKLLAAIKPIGKEIRLWSGYHETFVSEYEPLCIFRRNFHTLCWTPEGTVDKKKTAEVWMSNGELDIFKRYELACMYCLENYVLYLWEQLPETEFYLSREHFMKYEISKLVAHWSFSLSEESPAVERRASRRNDRFSETERRTEFTGYLFAFKSAVREGNSVATAYFLEKMSPDEKEGCLSMTISDEYLEDTCSESIQHNSRTAYNSETLYFLLSQMDEEQRREVFKGHSYGILKNLLDWPRQSLFVETLNLMWNFLSKYEYCILIDICITGILETQDTDSYFPTLFTELWHQSSLSFKEYVFDNSRDRLLKLFEMKDEKYIDCILKYATAEEKNRLISSTEGKKRFVNT